jgi:hypothetical protein
VTDCGLPYSHDQHPFTQDGSVHICDGDVNKRRQSLKSKVSEIANADKQRLVSDTKVHSRKAKKKAALNRKHKKRRRRHK